MTKRKGPPRDWSDKELVSLVWDWRIENGACTLDDLVRATGMSKNGLAYRIRLLIDEGRLVRSTSAGSLRATDERLMRETPEGKLIDVKRSRARR